MTMAQFSRDDILIYQGREEGEALLLIKWNCGSRVHLLSEREQDGKTADTRNHTLHLRRAEPTIARFTQGDTYRGDGLNLYAYCANNPVYYEDPEWT